MTAHQQPLQNVKALFFDVFGTTVDWRKTVTRTLHTSATTTLTSSKSNRNNDIPASVRTKATTMALEDWGVFAAAWRETYHEFTRTVAASLDSDTAEPYKTVDQHHHDSLIELLADNGLTGLWNDDEVRELSLVWHRLDPWADTCEGIRRLNELGYITSTLSNGNVGLLQDMAEYAKLEWKEVVSAEMFES